ncbi:MAG: hypothetical protein KC461_11315 [Dehalococcoidia bacterium]|nr:hypothetical protein [Dehalococcoidia bacterium]
MALFSRSFLASVVGGVAIVAVGGTAFTAANTVPGTVAGSGTNTISGYTITDVAYTLNASNPQNMDAVVITYDDSPGDPSNARVSVDNGSTWHNCTAGINAGADTVTCDNGSTPAFNGTTVASASNLIVVLTD